VADSVYVVRKIDYDGARRGYIWKEKLCKKLAKAELLFSEWSRPERYGSTSEPYTPCSYPDREPEGFIKSVCCRRSMLVVEMCQIQLED
jgi:hypothetical protein